MEDKIIVTVLDSKYSDSPSLPGQHFLRLWVVDEDVKQVFLLQDEEVCKAVCFYVGSAPVSAIFSRLQ